MWLVLLLSMFSRFIHVVTGIRALFLLWLNKIRTTIHFKLYFGRWYKWGVQLCCFTGSDSKDSVCSVGEVNSISGSGGCPGEGNGYAHQCSCLQNPMDRGAWLGYSPWSCRESDSTKWLTLYLFIHLAQYFLFKRPFSPNKSSWYPCQNQLTINVVNWLLLDSQFHFIDLSFLMPVPYCLDYCCFDIRGKFWYQRMWIL